MLLKSSLASRKSPHPAFGHLSPMLRTGEGKTLVSSESRLSKICLHPCSCGPSWILRKFSPDSPALKRGEGDFDHAASSAWLKATPSLTRFMLVKVLWNLGNDCLAQF